MHCRYVYVLIWIVVVVEVKWWFMADFWLFVVLVLELRYPVLESGTNNCQFYNTK